MTPKNNKPISTPPGSSQLTIACHRPHYLASDIARAVEDTDTHLLGLSILPPSHSDDPTDDMVRIVITVSRENPMPVINSLIRYGYTLVDILTPDNVAPLDPTFRDRSAQLLHLLEL